MKSRLSEPISLVALAATVVLIVAAACGGNDAAESGAAQGAGAAAPTTEPGAAQAAGAAAPTTESGAPGLPPDTPAPSANETVPAEIEAAARKLLADELGADEEGFRLDSSEGMGWPDTSLGCPQEGMAYAQVLTPGYKLVFDLAGRSHAVHTNSDGSHLVICRDAGAGAPALPLDTPAPSANDPVAGDIETAARKLLADELDVDEGNFRLDSSEAVGWPDTALGCPQQGYAYAQVLTPGYKLVFDLAGTSHAVHTNSDGSHMVICRNGQ